MFSESSRRRCNGILLCTVLFWGDRYDQLPVLIDHEDGGSQIEAIPRNLRFALEDVLYTMENGVIERLLLWADAISIDQANIWGKNE
jgi:hypothetical protein